MEFDDFDDFDERLADALEKRAALLSPGKKRIFLEAAMELRLGAYNASTIATWFERELTLEENVEMARWETVPNR